MFASSRRLRSTSISTSPRTSSWESAFRLRADPPRFEVGCAVDVRVHAAGPSDFHIQVSEPDPRVPSDGTPVRYVEADARFQLPGSGLYLVETPSKVLEGPDWHEEPRVLVMMVTVRRG